MKIKLAALTLALAALPLAAMADKHTGAEVLKAKGCLNCHDAEKKKMGPAMKDIAAKQKGKSAQLVEKLKNAKGHPKVNATEAEIKQAVDAMLATK